MPRSVPWFAIFNLLLGLAALLVLVVGGIVLIVKGVRDHSAGDLIGGSFLVVIGAAVPAVLGGTLVEVLLRRMIPGHKPPAVTISVDQTRVVPGGHLAGRVKVTESGHVRRLGVALRCHDRTPDYKGTSMTIGDQTLATGELTAANEFPFTLALPPDAPPSYSTGTGIEIWWEVGAHCNVFGPDVHCATKVEVALGATAGRPAPDTLHPA